MRLNAKPSKPPTATSTHPVEAGAPASGRAKARIEQSAATQAPHPPPAAAQTIQPRPPVSSATNVAPPTTSGAVTNPQVTISQDAVASQVVPEPAGPAAKGGGYVWVNRFPRQIGAQNAAQKIEGMGLPVTIIPRHNAANDSQFFVVLSGPFPAAKIDSVVQRLKGNGFALARPNLAVAAARKDPGAVEKSKTSP